MDNDGSLRFPETFRAKIPSKEKKHSCSRNGILEPFLLTVLANELSPKTLSSPPLPTLSFPEGLGSALNFPSAKKVPFLLPPLFFSVNRECTIPIPAEVEKTVVGYVEQDPFSIRGL